MATTLALVVCTALALSFVNTRSLGIIGTGLLILLFPIITTVLALLLGAAFFVYHRYLKGK